MNDDRTILVRRHQLAGWWALVVFVSLGITLEALHGFKASWYLDLGNETRRHLLTLAHAHGTLVALVNLAFAASPMAAANPPPVTTRVASACFLVAGLLLPAGFFLGGLVPSGGDPGLGIVAVPVGAAALLIAVAISAAQVTRRRP